MTDKAKKIIGIGGAAAIVLGAAGMFLSGASVGEATGIVGLAFTAVGGLAALYGKVFK